MRTSTIVMMASAVVFGLLAVFVARAWLNHQAELRFKSMNPGEKPVAMKTVVVASALPTHLTTAWLPSSSVRIDSTVT